MSGLVRGDATALPLADESVDLVVTSPPYFSLRSYSDGGEHYDGQIGSEDTPAAFLEALWAVTAECKRVLKPSGSMFVNLGDKYAGSGGHNNSGVSSASTLSGNGHEGGGAKLKATRRTAPDRYNQTADVPTKSLMGLPWLYAAGCTGALGEVGGPRMSGPCSGWPESPTAIRGVDLGLRLVHRGEIVWNKPNGLPESVTDRVRRSHEQWFHLTKEPRYFSAVDEIREPARTSDPGDPSYRANGKSNRRVKGVAVPPGQGEQSLAGPAANRAASDPLGKLPGSVWEIPSEPLRVPDWLGVDHFAAFPQEWPRRLILGWSPEDGVVLDPFAGTGTTVMVARALGRTGIGVDLSADYLRLANWRVYESGHAAKTLARTNAERQGVLL